MTYNRWLPPPSGPSAPELIAEAHRRENGPICAQCQFCPWDERELPPLVATDSRPATRTARPLSFRCEATGRDQDIDGGRVCRHFQRKR